MSTAKHTPGPWSLFPIETGWIVNQAGAAGYICTLPSVSHRAAECAANARLIVTAPEMSVLLGECRDAIQWCAEECGHKEAAALALRIDALLAKATGSAA